MSKYIKIYENLCPGDQVGDYDSRRSAIMAEMRAIRRAASVADAAKIIEWWGWNDDVRDSRRWVRKARKLMGVA